MRLKNLIFYNRAPFHSLKMTFDNSNVLALIGINGAGKTTILSHIVDSFYELARSVYSNEFEGIEYKYYRVSSDMYTLDSGKCSIVYFRFVNDNDYYDYIDIRGNVSEEEYNSIVALPNAISFSAVDGKTKKESHFKYWSITDEEVARKIFENNILTYFPSYRYETPSYLTDPYKVKLEFNKEQRLSGYLSNPIEVTSDLPEIANWMMDVVLDMKVNDNRPAYVNLFNQINTMISNILMSKVGCKIRLGIGIRNSGASRIAIMSRENSGVQIYPSIFSMSSGELALLCLFGELIKQADTIGRMMEDVAGIVLVDEIDKHLHMRLQKETLPKLISMFPNIQFIVSSHSPFLGLGLKDSTNISYQIRDLDKQGRISSAEDNDIFEKIYNLLIESNKQYWNALRELQDKIKSETKPLIITEGKTDWKHIKAACKALNISDLDLDYYEYEETKGDSKLKECLQAISTIEPPRKIIGIFDRDNFDELKWPELAAQEYIHVGSNVYAFAIPLVRQDEYGEQISIEHYYKRSDLTKVDIHGRRIYLGDEFYANGLSKNRKLLCKYKRIDKRAMTNGIIDDRVYDIIDDPEGTKSLALSKANFAEYVYNEDEFAREFDFTAFEAIFSVLRKIVTDND